MATTANASGDRCARGKILFTTMAKAPPIAALDHEHRRQRAAGSSGPERDHQHHERLEHRNQNEQLQCQIIVQNVFNRVVTNAQDTRNEKSDDAEPQRSDRRMPQVGRWEAGRTDLLPSTKVR